MLKVKNPLPYKEPSSFKNGSSDENRVKPYPSAKNPFFLSVLDFKIRINEDHLKVNVSIWQCVRL